MAGIKGVTKMRTEASCIVFLVVMVMIGNCIAVSTGVSDPVFSPATIYVPDDHETIQWAVDNATAGDTIIVRDGTYPENVKVNIERLTISSENGSAHTIIKALKEDHALAVTANHVSINGLTVKDAKGFNKVGLYIHAHYCNITNNTALNNPYGFFLSDSTKNTLINNIASDNFGDGIYLDYSDSNTLSNNTVVKSSYRNGIRLWRSHKNTVCNNDASNNNNGGIRLDYSHNNLLEKNDAQSNILNGILLNASNNNTLTNNGAKLNDGAGISLISSDNSVLTQNTASANNEIGISLYTSSNCTLTSNMMDGNYYNFGVSGGINHVNHTIDASNLVDGKPVYYWVKQRNREIPKDAGFVGVVLSSNITVKDLTLTNNSVGVMLAYSVNSSIENVRTSNNFNGIALYASINNTLINNTNSNNIEGIFMDSSSFNYLALNTNLNNNDGIFMDSSSLNNLEMNRNLKNEWGIFMESSNDNLLSQNINLYNEEGISMDSSNNNSLEMNRNSKNGWGIFMFSSNDNILSWNINSNNRRGFALNVSDYNILTRNNISNNNWTGISIGNSHNNIIFLNNFINNSKDAYPFNSTTLWNYPFEINYTYNGANYTNYMGNYWDDYIRDTGGSDLIPPQDSDGDGIGDRPSYHTISIEMAYYPLMKPFEFYTIYAA
jgi:parallel beta-helix repeat protein